MKANKCLVLLTETASEQPSHVLLLT